MLDRLKRLPWGLLLLVAVLAVAIATVLDLLLLWALQSATIASALSLVLEGLLGLLMPFLVSLGLGVLGVYFLEHWRTPVIINQSILWALVPCLLLVLFVKSLLVPPAFLLELSRTALVGIVVGVFWKGRPYWR